VEEELINEYPENEEGGPEQVPEEPVDINENPQEEEEALGPWEVIQEAVPEEEDLDQLWRNSQ
jgi:hypothetical protein